MPEISRFLGISVRMYYRDHSPPHIHAVYGEHAVKLYLDSGLIDGRFPRRALSSLIEWYVLHREELQDDWLRCERGLPLRPVAPLE